MTSPVTVPSTTVPSPTLVPPANTNLSYRIDPRFAITAANTIPNLHALHMGDECAGYMMEPGIVVEWTDLMLTWHGATRAKAGVAEVSFSGIKEHFGQSSI